MFEVKNLIKKFDNTLIFNNISCSIEKGIVYGIVGVNGAGKSTLLRHLIGIYKQDSGTVMLEGQNIYENAKLKEKIFYISDDAYFLPGATINKLGKYYKSIYPKFSDELFIKLKQIFGLNCDKPIKTFSKGQKRQVTLIIGISTCTDYLLLDETFDGLDPLVRIKVKKIILDLVYENNLTVIITSHNLSELESMCDKICLIYENKIVFEKDINQVCSNLYKIQVAFKQDFNINSIKELDKLSFSQIGSVINMCVRGNKEEIFEKLNKYNPLILEVLPFTLEEIFINELEALGYEKDIII